MAPVILSQYPTLRVPIAERPVAMSYYQDADTITTATPFRTLTLQGIPITTSGSTSTSYLFNYPVTSATDSAIWTGFNQTASTTTTATSWLFDTSGIMNTPAFTTAGTWPRVFPAVALRRAERLFQRVLTRRQTGTWRRWAFVDVASRLNPKVVYRLPKSGMVTELVDGVPTRKLCVYAMDSLPNADRLLSVKCFIEADETEFLATANVHPIGALSPRRALPPMVRRLQAA